MGNITLKLNPIQFAVVREDPEVETELLRPFFHPTHSLLIGSGGCTALTLQARFPKSSLTILDPNPAQLQLIRDKIATLLACNQDERYRSFGVESDLSSSLTGCGNFESLFRGLRHFLYEFVMDRDQWLTYFSDPQPNPEYLEEVFQSKYWPVAFRLYFSDALLVAMFGQNAIQHAEPSSYPVYFQKVFERGLRMKGAKSNYFLHHLLLGHYLKEHLPAYLNENVAAEYPLHFVNGLAQDVPDFGKFDLISLSNIFDWMPLAEVTALAQRISKEAKKGAVVVYRQLNNFNNIQGAFDQFEFDSRVATQLLAQDRSLFYSSLHIGRKHKGVL